MWVCRLFLLSHLFPLLDSIRVRCVYGGVFHASVHLRVLDGASNGPEQQELALESLLEFTREPALMLDVYINYDCDVQCTNLFETICHSLSSHALPRDGMVSVSHRCCCVVVLLPSFCVTPMTHKSTHPPI